STVWTCPPASGCPSFSRRSAWISTSRPPAGGDGVSSTKEIAAPVMTSRRPAGTVYGPAPDTGNCVIVRMSKSFSTIGCAPGGSLKGGVPSIAIASLADGAEAELRRRRAGRALRELPVGVEHLILDKVGHVVHAGAGDRARGRE